jgi:predicted CoA-substrate-specific enzyme activase
MYSLGIDIGASAVKLALLDKKFNLIHSSYTLHHGNIEETFRENLNQLFSCVPEEEIQYTGVSGSHSDLLHRYGFHKTEELPAIIEGCLFFHPDVQSIMELGGQNTKYITNFNHADGNLIFSMNNLCAAGTGSFFEDQMSRLQLHIEDISTEIKRSTKVPRIAGRCTVFAKTDIIHHQQEGTHRSDILLGLCYAAVKNYKAAIVKRNPVITPVMLIGGTVANEGIQTAIKELFSLADEDFLAAPQHNLAGAIGTAILAYRQNHQKTQSIIPDEICLLEQSAAQPLHLPPLCTLDIDYDSLFTTKRSLLSRPAACHLGIDVGSTSTNLVLIDDNCEVIDMQYLRTKGNPLEAVKTGLRNIQNTFGNKLAVRSVGTTGSGRHLIGKLIGADSIIDEITSQAAAALHFTPDLDYILEIGGQDSKFICCKDGKVTDFKMNKICAAGTGSFIEEQALRLHVETTSIGEAALTSTQPVDLGDRCTVFIETNISNSVSNNIPKEDILAGLCYSIVKNYLFKVVGTDKLDGKIALQGGVAYNQGIVSAFHAYFGERLHVSPYFSVTGALGIALLAKEQIRSKNTTFCGCQKADSALAEAIALSSSNMITPKVMDKPEKASDKVIKSNIDYFCEKKDMQKRTAALPPQNHALQYSTKKVVGIPRVLNLNMMFPLIDTFFKTLGYDTILSDETDNHIVELGQEYCQEETCFPIRLVYGHVASLLKQQVDYIFLPSIFSIEHAEDRYGYGCVYMQTISKIIKHTLDYPKESVTFLTPAIKNQDGTENFAQEMIKTGISLGKTKEACIQAMQAGSKVLMEVNSRAHQDRMRQFEELKDDEIAFVITARGYAIADPILNMDIPKLIHDMGHKVLSLTGLPIDDVSLGDDYPYLFWPFEHHLLQTAKFVKQHKNLYAIHLTNHCCGPDTIISHLFKEQMKDKPYLSIEVDEHSSNVGLITRLEAFMNSVSAYHKEISNSSPADAAKHSPINILRSEAISKERPLYIPWLYPFSHLINAYLQSKGYQSKLLPKTSSKTISIGRQHTITKEYLSLTSLIGDVVSKAKEDSAGQFLLFHNNGSEADGQFFLVIQNILSRLGLNNVIVSQNISNLLEDKHIADYFLLILSGDLVMSAPANIRQKMTDTLIDCIHNQTLDTKTLVQLKASIMDNRPDNKILITGEPYTIYNDALNSHILEQLEQEGYHLSYSPMSEYLLFLWDVFNESTVPFLQQYEMLLGNLNIQEKRSISASAFGDFLGANGKYRYAKINLPADDINGIINLCSTYENTQTIINLLSSNPSKPFINLSFDGTDNNTTKLKLSSFLHYYNQLKK